MNRRISTSTAHKSTAGSAKHYFHRVEARRGDEVIRGSLIVLSQRMSFCPVGSFKPQPTFFEE